MNAPTLYQLIYISVATQDLEESDLRSILETSRRNNARLGITGLLLYLERNIVQILEGPKANVEQVFEKIKADKRHHKIVMLSFEPARKRDFQDWAMGYKRMEIGRFHEELAGFTDVVERKDMNLKRLSALSIRVGFVLKKYSHMKRLDDLQSAC